MEGGGAEAVRVVEGRGRVEGVEERVEGRGWWEGGWRVEAGVEGG